VARAKKKASRETAYDRAERKVRADIFKRTGKPATVDQVSKALERNGTFRKYGIVRGKAKSTAKRGGRKGRSGGGGKAG
jgi:hypothetical protein